MLTFNGMFFWQIYSLFISLGFIASFFVSYGLPTVTLPLPLWTIPAWGYYFVWTVIYSLLGVLFYIGYKKDPYYYFSFLSIISIILHVVWTFSFFVYESVITSFIFIITQLLVTIWQMIYIFKYSKILSVVIGLYLIWIIYLTSINSYLLKTV